MTRHLEDIGILMLAAGQSRRFQGDKRQAPMADGRPLLQATLAQVPDTLTRRALVLRPGDEPLAEGIDARWEIVFASQANEGMGASLAAGVRSLCQWSCDWDCHWHSDWQGLLVGLGDMPLIDPASYRAVQEALCSQELVLPYYEGKRGHPDGIGRSH